MRRKAEPPFHPVAPPVPCHMTVHAFSEWKQPSSSSNSHVWHEEPQHDASHVSAVKLGWIIMSLHWVFVITFGIEEQGR